MVITRSLKNNEIYNLATQLVEVFNSSGDKQIMFPVKINFYFQKNMVKLVELAKEIEIERLSIIQKYGKPTEENEEQYFIPEENINIVNQELKDLFDLEQEVKIYMIDLDLFDGISMTPQQVAAFTFMINEEE